MKSSHSILCLFIITLFAGGVSAQSVISLSTGWSTDLNNAVHAFHHIPVSFNWQPLKDKRLPFLVELDYDIPLAIRSSGDAFTLNPALPGKVTLSEDIRPRLITASVGLTIPVYRRKSGKSIYVSFFPIAICNQDIKVTYKNYDKENYEVLNPDVTTKETGAVMAVAAVYNFHTLKQDLRLMLHLQTPLFKGNGDYQLSYKYVAPLQLTFGYNFYYNK